MYKLEQVTEQLYVEEKWVIGFSESRWAHILFEYYDDSYYLLDILKEMPYRDVLAEAIASFKHFSEKRNNNYFNDADILQIDNIDNESIGVIESIANKIVNMDLSGSENDKKHQEIIIKIMERKNMEKNSNIERFKRELVVGVHEEFYYGLHKVHVSADFGEYFDDKDKAVKTLNLYQIINMTYYIGEKFIGLFPEGPTKVDNLVRNALNRLNNIQFKEIDKKFNDIDKKINDMVHDIQNVNDVINLFADIDKNRLNTDDQINSINKRLDKIEQMLIKLIEKD